MAADTNERCRVLLAGGGGGGCNALGTLRAHWVDAPEMVVMHTDSQMLSACPIPSRVVLGLALTRGLSAGGDPEIGRRAAEEAQENLRQTFSDVDLAVVVAGLGGGTGTGAAPVVCRAAREAGATTLCFCTLPFFFEGQQRRMRAEDGLRELRQSADAVIALPNQRLMEWVDPSTQVTSAFTLVDQVIGSSVRALWKLLSQPGLINLDFADLRRLVESSGGTLAMAFGEAEGEHKAQGAVAKLAESPLLEHGSVLAAAHGLLVGVLGGPDMTLLELQAIMSAVTGMARPDVSLHMGTAIDPEYAGRVAITLLATEHRDLPEPAAEAKAPAPDAEAAPEAAAGADGAPAAAPAAEGKAKPDKRSGKNRTVQTELTFEKTGRGRFLNVEPTLYEGEDLDVPAFLRRGIKLPRVP